MIIEKDKKQIKSRGFLAVHAWKKLITIIIIILFDIFIGYKHNGYKYYNIYYSLLGINTVWYHKQINY